MTPTLPLSAIQHLLQCVKNGVIHAFRKSKMEHTSCLHKLYRYYPKRLQETFLTRSPQSPRTTRSR